MTAPTADQKVASWMHLSREPGTIHRLKSGGVVVEVGGAFPTWSADVESARDLLRGLGLPADGPVLEPPTA